MGDFAKQEFGQQARMNDPLPIRLDWSRFGETRASPKSRSLPSPASRARALSLSVRRGTYRYLRVVAHHNQFSTLLSRRYLSS